MYDDEMGPVTKGVANFGPAVPRDPIQPHNKTKARLAGQIEVQMVTLGVSGAWFTYGIIAWIIWYHFPDKDKYARDCAVFDGNIVWWIGWMSYLLTAYGFFGLVYSGCVPRLLLLMKLRDEALCCSDVCQGLCGSVVRSFIFFVLVAVNSYGTFIIVKVIRLGVQTKDQEDTNFCQKVVFEFALATNVLMWAVIFLLLLLTCRACFLALKYEKKEANVMFGPKGENLEKVLGLMPEQQRGRSKRAREHERKKGKKLLPAKKKALPAKKKPLPGTKKPLPATKKPLPAGKKPLPVQKKPLPKVG